MYNLLLGQDIFDGNNNLSDSIFLHVIVPLIFNAKSDLFLLIFVCVLHFSIRHYKSKDFYIM